MALKEGKKGFIVYCSWSAFLNELSNEQVGQWFNWMMDYTNDKNPEYPEDTAVRMACKMTQTILKNDLEKYREKVERITKAREQRNINNEINTDINTEINNENTSDKVKDKVIVKDKVKVKDNNNYLKESNRENEADKQPTPPPKDNKSSKAEKHKHGEYEQVKLTEDEYNRLCSKFGKGYIDAVIKAIDEYKKMTGNKNKWVDDNLVIQRAIREKWKMIDCINQEQENNKEPEQPEDVDVSWIET